MAALDALAKLYIARGSYGAAAAVFEALATRRAGLGDAGVSLPERLDLYQSAVLQARPCAPACVCLGPCMGAAVLPAHALSDACSCP